VKDAAVSKNYRGIAVLNFKGLRMEVLMKIAVFFISVLLFAQSPAPMGQMGCPQSGMMKQHMAMARSAADREYMQSMMTMHQGMMAHPLTGEADHDFMVMMIPHHQAAIEMAKTELKYGKNPQLRAMSQAIIKAQQAEIDQMQAMLHR
jgi:uncharacterized protein (DUF305 family)